MARAKDLSRRLARLRRRRKGTDMASPVREVIVRSVDAAGNVIQEIERVKNLWWIEPPKETDK